MLRTRYICVFSLVAGLTGGLHAGVAPLPGSGLPRDRVAGNPRSISAADLARDGRLAGGGLTETLERTSASVTRNDTGGNPLQRHLGPDVARLGFRRRALQLRRDRFGGMRAVF